VCDINPEMLALGRERAIERGLDDVVAFTEGNAEAVPFADRSFDAVAIEFGIRNVPRIERALAEAYRVLKIGGRFVCLEFSFVDVPGLDRLYDFYSFNVIPALGRAVTGDAEAYRYLVESIRQFPPPESFADLMRAAGLARVSFRPLTGGIAALHSGWRL
jgi:demethylmenaquinone methyltransferase/2-methoxy-6-polyprenyl-1,4-benzoquinol methylase